MAQVRPIQSNFTGGEISPLLAMRVDTAKYVNGCKQLDNFVVTPYGGVRRRPATIFTAAARDHTKRIKLVRFQYSTSQAYVLAFSENAIRFFTPSGGIVTQAAQSITGITKANPAVVTYSGSDTYANGDRVIISGVAGMTEVNNREFTVANVNTGANTFELSGVNSSGYGAYTSGGTVAEIFEVTTTYSDSEVNDLRFTQSSDVLYIFHRLHKPAKLVRNSALSWALSDVTVVRGPWRSLNTDQTITIKANDWVGSVTLEASSSTFLSGHVGAKFKLYHAFQGKYETEWGTANNPTVGSLWAANGLVYEVTAAVSPDSTTKHSVPSHKKGTVRSLQAGLTSGNYADLKFIHQGFGIVDISAYASGTEVSGTVYDGYGYTELPRSFVDSAMTGGATTNPIYTSATALWQEGAWSDYRGYPGIVTFFEQRLMAASNASEPQTIWGSVSGNLTDFEEGTNDNQALNYTIASEEVENIVWMSPGKQLLIGTISGEYVMQSSSLNEAVTPKNVKISRETKYGSANVEPVRIGSTVLFVQRYGDPDNYGRKIREMAYDFQSDNFQSIDLTVWAEHITGTGISCMTHQAEPDNVVWCPRVDGYMAAVTYQRDQEIVAWHRHFLGGYSNSGDTVPPIIESIVTVPGEVGEEVWMVVNRYIDGGTKRYIEYMATIERDTAKEDMKYLDSLITYSGSSTSVISGLWHLKGEVVTVLGDGANMGEFTVDSAGKITLPTPVTKAQVGLRYKSVLQTNDLEAGAQMGSSQGQRKKITHVVARLFRSLGGLFGSNASSKLDEIQYRTTGDVLGDSPPLFTGDKQLKMPSAWGSEGTVYFETDGPYPLTILGIVTDINTSG